MSEEMSMPKQGAFCWAEIATNDLETCKTFYKNVFGWEMDESKAAGPGMVYQEFNLPGEYPMGGMFNMKDIFGDHCPPPHFMNYISVENVDESAAKVESLGGKLCQPPKDIPNVGRMVTIEDPTGALVTLITLQHH